MKIQVPSKFVSQAQVRYFFAIDDKLSKYQIRKIHKLTRGVEVGNLPETLPLKKK